MTNQQALLPKPQHHKPNGRQLFFQNRPVVMATFCLAVVAVLATQYSAMNHADIQFVSKNSIAVTKDDFIAESVVKNFPKASAATSSRRQDDVGDHTRKKTPPTEPTLTDVPPIHQEEPPYADPGLDYHGTPLHIVFSTSCDPQMHWESYVFFYHAWKVRQPGTVTRIASGCREKRKTEETLKFHKESIQTMSDRFHLHLTPDFSKQRIGSDKSGYKYMNKPFGLRSWMENVLHMNTTTVTQQTGVEDGVVILMDPDMVLLRPLLHDFSQEDVIWVEGKPATTIVKHGYPIAQQDGYLGNQWMDINASYVTGDPTIQKPKERFGPLHWNTGPPYLATVKDMYKISKLWTEYAPRVDAVNPGLFAEMQGYIWATYKLKLPHTLIKSLVVSTTETARREGWAYIDNLPEEEVCVPSHAITALPIGLHYCQSYAVGPEFFFSKYRLKKKFLSCDKNLMMPPPKDIHKHYDYFLQPPPPDGLREQEKNPLSPKQAKREAFMLCGMIEAVNEAAAYYKTHNCGKDANFHKVYTIHNDPGKW